MPQQVQELIDKIKTEGVQAADKKAKEIESSARTDAQKILSDAHTQAKQIIAAANTEARRIREVTQTALTQAARDTLLSLRREIEKILGRVVLNALGEALSSEHLAKILSEIIKKAVETNLAADDILVGLNPREVSALKDGFVAKLQKEVKKSITIQPREDIGTGFTISFDRGKSCFDFSDASLAEFLSGYLNSQIAEIIKDSTQ